MTMSPSSIKAFAAGWLPRLLLVLPIATMLACSWLFVDNTWASVFFTIFALRYTRLVGHFIGYWLYSPTSILENPTLSRSNVTVILPTIDPNGPDFEECVLSILVNEPAVLLVITVGDALRTECQRVLEKLRRDARLFKTKVAVSALSEPSKRRQVAHAVPRINTAVTILADDHVFWPSRDFIPSVLAPFSNHQVGVVATKKRVRRTTPGVWSWPSIVNFIACNYLERHNWELRASNAIDGGVFVVSGRTAAYRTMLLADGEFLQRFCNEKFFFGLFGGVKGLDPDDDNFLTRHAMKNNWLIRFQDTEDATIQTTLGEYPKFRGQLLRWARTTFRSNPVMLKDPKFLYRYTWSAFMVYWAGIVNFAILWDAALILSLSMSENMHYASIPTLLCWMIWTKMVKIMPQLLQNPKDFSLVICQVVFGYVHSVIKFWALITFWDCGWSGRNLEEVRDEEQELDTSFHPVKSK